MNPPAHPSSTSSAAGPSSIRPRNRRLHSSTVDNETSMGPAEGGAGSSRLISPAVSERPSRVPSPIPSKHPSRPPSSHAGRSTGAASNGRLLSGSGMGSSQRSTSFATGLWGTSWTTLQGLASTVLGNDAVGDADKDKPKASMRPARRKRPPEAQHRRIYSTNVEGNWGPAPDPQSRPEEIAGGTTESREALVRAKKREDMLSANGHAVPDLSGRFKRRLSDERGPSSSAPPIEHESEAERDALVYVHHVQPRDTLAGVIIQFSCQPAVFRKANRLWPNDSIQTRKTVLLPVDACGVKGKPVPEPVDLVDLVEAETDPQSSSGAPNQDPWGRSKTSSTTTQRAPPVSPPLSSSTMQTTDEPPWQHAYWVEIEGQSGPVEIARLSRRTLGYFPPSRRKSLSFSDLDTPPSASLDLPRPSLNHDLAPPLGSPGANSITANPNGRSRRDSASRFAQQMHGPGGVGTLGGRATSLGPKQDNLNKFLARHLPDVAPKEGLESLLSSTGSASTSTTSLDNVGTAIEGWMRKLAKGAAAIVENPGAMAPSAGAGGGGSGTVRGRPGNARGRMGARNGSGDLIELTDGLDLDAGSGSSRFDGRLPSASSSRQDPERALRERVALPSSRGLNTAATLAEDDCIEGHRRAGSSGAEGGEAAAVARRRTEGRKKGD